MDSALRTAQALPPPWRVRFWERLAARNWRGASAILLEIQQEMGA